MNKWYSPERAGRLQSRARLCKWIMFLLAFSALAGCVFLCTRVTTGNASRLLALTIGLSTLGGWAVLLITFFLYRPLRAQAGHIRSVAGGEKAQYTGLLTVSRESFQIPGSVAVRKAKLETEQGTLTFDLNAALVRRLPPAGETVRVTAVRRFITAVEVLGHEEA
jgi:hypothetical protein